MPTILRKTTGYHESCAILGGAEIALDRCATFSAQKRNRAMCNACTSPNKYCVACVDQSIFDENSFVTGKGEFCEFHRTHGRDAKREKSVPTLIDAPASDLDKKFTEEKPEEVSGKSSAKITPEEAEGKALSEAQIIERAHRMLKFKARYLKLCEGLSRELPDVGLANLIGLPVTQLNNPLSSLRRELDLLHLPLLQGFSNIQKSQILRKIIARIYNEYLTLI